MRRLITISGLILTIVLTAVQSASPVTQTMVFQQGLGGYGGVRDTWVSSEDSGNPPQHTVNYGQNQDLVLLRDGGDNPLIRFDLSQISDNSTVISAILSLYNTTHSSYSGTQDFARRIELFCVLRDWDEGNQVASPIDGPGRHGATGDYAFDYYPGEGIDIPWGERGMAREADYANTPKGYADVINEGWYSWDITGLVQDWVRGKVANFGIVLRDATGYEDNHVDWRTFVSSQGDGGLRPKLTVVFNPDTPMADAGPDQENLNWDRGPITLDASASRDRPGGNNGTLTYSWGVVRPAYGSSMSGVQVGNTGISSFTPDVPGEWDIELRVSNSMGESATDTVHLRLLSIPSGHPRIYLTAERLAQLRARALPSNFRWTQLLEEALAPDGEMAAKALVSQVTGETSYCNEAIAMALTLIANAVDWPTKAGDIALIYDWCFGCLTDPQRTTFINYFNAWGDDVPKSEDEPGWGNYWPRYGYSYGLMGLATHGENPRAKEWLDEFRLRRYRDHDLPLLDHIREGGAWPEGTVYDWIANWPRVKALEAWQTATGENLFESTAWYRNRLNYLLLLSRPGIAEQWGTFYHPYPSTGDAERNRGSMANYGRIMGLILIGHYGSTTSARELQAYLSTPPADKSGGFLCHEEFLWFNPDQASHPPSSLTHYSPATGTLLMRSNWPDSAADQDPSATYITFQCGDHFTYHQHYDQNSFTLFKYEDLLVDSGVYSGEGLSYHDINYYIRSIAHNTLVVYNPAEDFSQVRADAVSNDGGQRTVYPASRSPGSLEYFEEHRTHYNTGDMVRFFEEPYYTYAFGDATKAYNNPTYNQAMDAGLMGNVAKVNRFHRELVYLRPRASGDPEYLVLFDRVSVTESAFSGENTKLLFHTLSEPVVNGTAGTISPGEVLYSGADLATAVSGEGKIFIKVLLPRFRNIRKVGGRGIKAFWVFGANYDWHWSPDEPQPRPTNDFEDIPYGEWRLELEPADTDLDHHFLTVLYPASSLTMTMPSMDLIAGNGMEGVHVGDPSLNRVVLFSSAPDGSPPLGPFSYTYAPTGPTQHLLFDLEQGRRYQVSMLQSGGNVTVTLTPSEIGLLQVTGEGTLRFDETGTEQQYALTISKSGAGSGTVTSDPAGINCGNDCSKAFNQGTSVTLTATPATGSAFAGWSGACSGTGDCVVMMDSDKSVTATFNVQAQYSLTVVKAGTGDGIVTSSPAGINCGSNCSGTYIEGTSVTLTATPSSGSVFGGWSGYDSTNGNTCTVAMNQNKTVIATFTPCATPGTPSTPTPSNGSTGISTSPTLSWARCANTNSYDVYFGTSTNPPYVGNTTSTSYPSTGSSNSTTYYWKIVAKNSCGNSTSGPVWNFTTVSAAEYKFKWNTTMSAKVSISGIGSDSNVTYGNLTLYDDGTFNLYEDSGEDRHYTGTYVYTPGKQKDTVQFSFDQASIDTLKTMLTDWAQEDAAAAGVNVSNINFQFNPPTNLKITISKKTNIPSNLKVSIRGKVSFILEGRNKSKTFSYSCVIAFQNAP